MEQDIPSSQPDQPGPTSSNRQVAMLIAVVYVCSVIAVCATVRPLAGNTLALIGIGLLPTLLFAACGLFKIRRSRPFGIMVLFHVVIYPILFGLVMGAPGVVVAWQLSKLFGS